MKKRILAFLAAGAITVSLAGCSVQGGSGEESNYAGGSVFTEPTTVSVMIPQGNELYRADWKVWQYIEEATGADLDIQMVAADYETKLAMAFSAPETIPDLIAFDYKPHIDNYAEQGGLVALEDVIDQMPNFRAFWDKVDPEEKEALFQIRRSADGKTYWPSRYGFSDIIGLKTWMYREDIFEKHGLEAPETYEELYEVAKKLKELYPDSYPIGCENFFNHVAQTVGPQWKPNFEYWEYYDFANDKWCYGAIEDTMLDMVKTFKRFFEEELINPTFTGTTAREFNELVTTDRTFMFPHFQVRMAIYDSAVQGVNDEFKMAPMTPPVANAETGIPYMSNFRADTNGLGIANSGNEKRIENAVKLFDWFYSDEAYELLSWGKEGETYEVVNGEKKFLITEEEDIRNKFGFQTYASGQALDPAAVESYFLGSTTKEYLDIMKENVEKTYNPQKWIGFTDEEQATRSELGTAIRNYAQEMISKFMLGQAPLTEWDSFVKTVNEMGLEELLKVYENAYNRVK